MIDCSTVGKVPQTYRGNQGVFKYLAKKNKSLNGPFIKTNDSPDAERSTDVLTKAAQHAGIDVTSTPVLSNRDQQSAFTTDRHQDEAGRRRTGPTTAWPRRVQCCFRQEAALQGLTDPDRRVAVHQRLLRPAGDGGRGRRDERRVRRPRVPAVLGVEVPTRRSPAT